jgi:DNA-binding NarL/FixJ family response regulator
VSVGLLVLAEEWLLAHGVASLLKLRFETHAVESFESALRFLDMQRPAVALWIGDRVDGPTVERLNTLLEADEHLRICLVARTADSKALRSLLRRGRHGVAVLQRADGLDAGELLAVLEGVLTGRSTVEPHMLEDLFIPENDVLSVLSPQDQEVLEFVAYGLRNRAIAARLWKSEKAVEKQVSRILLKLGLDGEAAKNFDRRVAAARLFFRSRPDRISAGDLAAPIRP